MADIAASVLAKLRNKAKASGISYQQCLQHRMCAEPHTEPTSRTTSMRGRQSGWRVKEEQFPLLPSRPNLPFHANVVRPFTSQFREVAMRSEPQQPIVIP